MTMESFDDESSALKGVKRHEDPLLSPKHPQSLSSVLCALAGTFWILDKTLVPCFRILIPNLQLVSSSVTVANAIIWAAHLQDYGEILTFHADC